VLSNVPLLKPMLELLLTFYAMRVSFQIQDLVSFCLKLDAGVMNRFLRDDKVMFIFHDVNYLFLRSFLFYIELHKLFTMCIPFFVRDAPCSD
jgi:hypothetical protein